MAEITTEDRKPNPVDLHVGARIRLRRKTLGFSQEQLAEALGLTFQQIQKYERGSNRVSCSKLWDIARKLDVGTDYFFEGLDAAASSTGQPIDDTSPVNALVGATGGLEVARGYLSAPYHGRQAMLSIARAFTGAAPAQAA